MLSGTAAPLVDRAWLAARGWDPGHALPQVLEQARKMHLIVRIILWLVLVRQIWMAARWLWWLRPARSG